MNQSEIEANICNRCQARENVCEQGTISFGFAADWLRRWHVFCWPITERSEQNQSKRETAFDTQLKSALYCKQFISIL